MRSKAFWPAEEEEQAAQANAGRIGIHTNGEKLFSPPSEILGSNLS
jgi:hypothetical protein